MIWLLVDLNKDIGLFCTFITVSAKPYECVQFYIDCLVHIRPLIRYLFEMNSVHKLYRDQSPNFITLFVESLFLFVFCAQK